MRGYDSSLAENKVGPVGIAVGGDIFQEYDMTWDAAETFSAEDRQRLAKIMIARWKKFGDII